MYVENEIRTHKSSDPPTLLYFCLTPKIRICRFRDIKMILCRCSVSDLVGSTLLSTVEM